MSQQTAVPGRATDGVGIKEQGAVLLQHAAGYIAHRTISIGLRQGLLQHLATHGPADSDALTRALGVDPLYARVWCRSALAAGILERAGTGYRLAPHMATLLLDPDSPAFTGGLFAVTEMPEMFGRFESVLRTGERMWWDETSPDWIAAVAQTGRPFYTRLVPGGLSQVPGLEEELRRGVRVVDTACGAGHGLVRLAREYPASTVSGVDGDAHSVELARRQLADAGLADRVSVTTSSLEELALEEPADVILNNISMHECRDIDRVTANVKASLRPGGWFVISDFPFPEDDATLRTVPGRIMSGIQFFEAQIGDQLLPRSSYDALLERHGFTEIGSVSLTPVHALTYGRRP